MHQYRWSFEADDKENRLRALRFTTPTAYTRAVPLLRVNVKSILPTMSVVKIDISAACGGRLDS